MGNTLVITVLIFFLTLSSNVWSDGLTFEDLVEKNGTFYLKATNSPYTGKINETVNMQTDPKKGTELFELKGQFINGIKTSP
tara:strand:+ start:550 stop:795 length:246 start_codon:yes stop_codon:yes gene_type:complete